MQSIYKNLSEDQEIFTIHALHAHNHCLIPKLRIVSSLQNHQTQPLSPNTAPPVPYNEPLAQMALNASGMARPLYLERTKIKPVSY